MNQPVSKLRQSARRFNGGGVGPYCPRLFNLGLFAAAALLFALPARAADKKSVLVVTQGNGRQQSFIEFTAGLQQGLATNFNGPVTVYIENLDFQHFDSPDYRREVISWLRVKYAGRKLDAIVTENEETASVTFKIRDALWLQVPLIYVDSGRIALTDIQARTNYTSVPAHLDVKGTLDEALRLFPDARRIAFVSSIGNGYVELYHRELKQVQDFATNRLEVVPLIGLTMAETKQRLSALPDQTIVFYNGIWLDGAGQYFTTPEALEELRSACRAPIFGCADTYLGRGAVGGSCRVYRDLGVGTADQVAAVIRAGGANSVRPGNGAGNRFIFDWRQLHRFGLDQGLLPRDSEVRFRPPTLWESYRGIVLVVLAALLVQTGLIAALLVQRYYRRRAEQRFRSLLENAPDAVYVQTDGRIAYVNRAALRLLLADRPEQLIGRPAQDLVAAEPLENAAKKARPPRAKDGPPPMLEQEYLRLDRTRVAVEVREVPVVFQGEQSTLIFARDITERKRLEEQLRQSQKMEAFGQLAGGVAHDFNNLLTVVLGHAALLQVQQSLPPDQAASMAEIVKAGERAANLTRQLLTFSRRQPFRPKPLDLNEVVANITKMLQRLIGEHITLETRFAPGDAPVVADRTMMEQILVNLAVNSRDAMPKGGHLAIQTAVVVINEADAQAHPKARPGTFVGLKVSDTGCGIAPKEMERIFEPFFTTKEVGKGTGLGLATIFGIVEQHHGWIEVDSQVNRGTTFRILLPRLTGSEKHETEFFSAAEIRGGHETILLVEDEAPVRSLVRTLLERNGYRILEADCGPVALKIWERQRDAIDLLFTDVVMPSGMSGRELAGRLLAEKPALKVLYASGYTDDMLGEDSPLRNTPNFLEKPFESQILLKRVRESLDGAAGG